MRVKMSEQPQPAPTASAIGPCPTEIQIVGRPGTRSLPSTIAPLDHPLGPAFFSLTMMSSHTIHRHTEIYRIHRHTEICFSFLLFNKNKNLSVTIFHPVVTRNRSGLKSVFI